MAATGELKARIQLLQAAVARGEATGKTLKPELQAELDSYRQQGLLGTSGGGGTTASNPEQQSAIRAEAVDKIRLARSLKDRSASGWFTTGVGAKTAASIGGTGAYDLAQDTDTLKNAGALQRVMQLARDNGGKNPLTPLSNSDFQALASSLSNLDTGQSDSQYQRNVDRVIELYKRAYQGAGGTDLEAELAGKPTGQDAASAGATGPAPGSTPPPTGAVPNPFDGGGGGAGPNVYDPGSEVRFGDHAFNALEESEAANAVQLSDQQRGALVAAIQGGASEDQVTALFNGFGLTPNADEVRAAIGIYKDPANRNRPLAINVDNRVQAIDPTDSLSGKGTVGAGIRGVSDGVTAGAANYIAAGLRSATSDETYDQALHRYQGYTQYDEENDAGARTAGVIAGSLLLPSKAKAVSRAAGIAAVRGGATAAEARVAANLAFARQTALEAGGYGGVSGFNTAEGGFSDRLQAGLVSAGLSAATGGLLTYGGGRAAMALRARGRVAPTLTEGQQALQAAERQGIVPLAADVGGSMTRRATAGISQTLAGSAPIRRAVETTLNSAEAVRDRVARSIGTPAAPEQAGEVAAQGAKTFIARTGQRIGRIYDAAAAASGQARVDMPEARRILDMELAGLRESPVQGPGVAVLEGFRSALDRPLTIRGLREARTQMRDLFESSGLRASNVERIAGRVIDAATDDMVNGLRAQGLDQAARRWRIADRMWRERLETIDDVLQPILKDSGEKTVDALQAAMRGNNKRFTAFLDAMPPNEEGIVRASLVQRLGRATSGQQDDAGEVFSLNTFLTNWDKIGESAKNRLFGADGRAALNDLARYAAAAREAQRVANVSNTSGAVLNAGGLIKAAEGAAAFATYGKALAATYGAGRLLASPRFARWLARSPRQANPAATAVHIERLSRIARAEPAILNEVLGLQQMLRSAFGHSPQQRVAEDEQRRLPAERQPVYETRSPPPTYAQAAGGLR